MKLSSMPLGLLAIVIATCFAVQAEAGDTGSANGAQTAVKLNQQIDQAIGSAGTSSSDVDTRIKDLESTRADIDGKKPPTVSLSVSGWVDQEVQFNNPK